MAIYGIGAYYNGTDDVSEEFVNKNLACIGWDASDAPTLHLMLRYIKVGDIIYIKSAPIGQGLRVKAIGIVADNSIVIDPIIKTGITMKWIWTGNDVINVSDDKNNIRNNTLYEELDIVAQKEILSRLFKTVKM